MGYDVYITRAVLWMKSEDDCIPLDLWQSAVNADIELTWDPSNGPHSARWNQCGSTEIGWFDWRDGNVYTRSPSRAGVGKMLAMAGHFSARVQGDDGEVYEHEQDWLAPSH